MARGLDVRTEELFMLLGTLECATSTQLYRLFFAREFKPGSSWNPRTKRHYTKAGISVRSARARLKRLGDRGYLATVGFGRNGRGMRGVHLTMLGRGVYKSVAEAIPKRAGVPDASTALRGWSRAEIWAALNQSGDGMSIRCDQSRTAREYLERRAGDQVPDEGELPYDIAYGQDDHGRNQAAIIVVDDVRCNHAELVEKLPV